MKKISWKTVLYSLLFGFICVINHRIHTASPVEGWRETFRDMTGFVIAVIIGLHYTWSDILKYQKWHKLWTVAGGMLCLIAFFLRINHVIFISDWIVLVLSFFVWGYIIIQTIMTVFVEKKHPFLCKKAFLIWLAMILLMVVSRNEELWPLAYGIMFLCYYVTDFSQEERYQMLQGLLNGLIGSFFVFQAHAFLYRPYDAVRYIGWYTNSNNNALYYCFILAAVLVKAYICKKNGANKWWHVFYWLGIGTVFSFVILTIGRIGWGTSFVLAFLFLIFMKREWRSSIILRGMLILLCTALTFPLCYGAVRYIPPFRHHVVWFSGEAYSEKDVHSWDPWDSEKFVEIDEFAEAALGRITKTFSEFFKRISVLVEIDAADIDERFIPLYEDRKDMDGLQERRLIYDYFFTRLNMCGYKANEIGFQLLSDYWVGHAHNIYLQFGTQFGIPVMILFAGLLFWGIIKCWVVFKKTKNPEAMMNLYLILIPALFGMFEFTWGAGHMAITLLFVAWRMVLVKDDLVE